MKHALLLAIATTLLGLTLAGCTDDIPLNLSGQSQFDEGELVEVPLAVNVASFIVSNTRAGGVEEPSETEETVTDLEKQVDNIWVFQYDVTTKDLLVKPRYYIAENEDGTPADETAGTWTVRLKALVASKIYVVANVGSETWASSYEYFATEDLLLKQTLPSPYPVIHGTSEDGDIPMEGVNDGIDGNGVTLSPDQGEPVVVSVTRMYAKIKVKVNIDKVLLEQNNAYVESVTLSNIPWYCQVGTLYAAASMSTPATYPSDGIYWITRAINNKNDTDEEDEKAGYDYVFYIPENIQGVKAESTESDTKTDAAPDYATLLTAGIHYKEEGTEAEGVTYYAVCPGGNNVDNYNIRRNCAYRITLNIGYPIETTYQPSANCIYAAPGTTVSFEPYYRTEEGGGYQFSDYLAPNSDGGTGQQIMGVKILWQTEDCIGDNSAGDLVYFEPLKNNTDQTLHSRIYVTVKKPGNAVIAAYDADPYTNENANIIWSWHIWVPSLDVKDPTNEANGKLFTTYYWDNDGIYGYMDADGNVTTNPRTPGYTIMDLNLGALSSVPTSATFPETYGLLYQFGRKDPFPCARYSTRGEDYTDSITGPIYDNANTRVGVTADEVASGEENEYLFRSISGNTSKAYPTNYGVDYSIKHPTVFLCGTDEANNVNVISSLSHYVFNGNWTYEDTDNLWGATDVTDLTKKYLISADKNRHLYDDYGDEKSIFDPCPYGWRVSPPDLWLGFTSTGLNVKDGFNDVNYEANSDISNYSGMTMYMTSWREGATSFFPIQGTRAPDGCAFRAGQCGNYANATADTGDRVNILHIHYSADLFKIFENSILPYYLKSTASAVRCIRMDSVEQ